MGGYGELRSFPLMSSGILARDLQDESTKWKNQHDVLKEDHDATMKSNAALKLEIEKLLDDKRCLIVDCERAKEENGRLQKQLTKLRSEKPSGESCQWKKGKK